MVARTLGHQRSAWVPGAVGLTIVAIWAVLAIAVTVHAVPIEQAHQATLRVMQNPDPLADPPHEVALVELEAGIVMILALPAAVTAFFLALGAVIAHRGRGWALVPTWAALGIGGLGAIPALPAFLVGLATAFFSGLVVFD